MHQLLILPDVNISFQTIVTFISTKSKSATKPHKVMTELSLH